jgi:DNA modification methylase
MAAMTKANGPLQIRYVDPASLNLNEQNPRLMPPEEMAALKRSLAKWGFVDPIIVRRENGEVIGGHQRIAAAVELGIETVPVVEVDVSEIDALLLNVALNRIAGRWDESKLALVTDGLRLAGADLSLTGFTEGELRLYMQPKPGLTDPDAVPEVSEPISKAGDLWVCGDHRLLCGDSTKAEDVERLMAGEKAGLCVTDPPYGVDYDGGTKRRETLAGDTDAGVLSFLKVVPWTENASAYVWHAGLRARHTEAALLAAGFTPSAIIIWAKQQAQFGNLGARYHQQHEPIFYATRPRAYWGGSKNEATLWEYPRLSKNDLHPTQKPVALCDRAVGNSSPHGGLVVDPFLGSGTTMIACERLGRRCYGMEIEPRYVDVAVKRWEQFTGQEAQRG